MNDFSIYGIQIRSPHEGYWLHIDGIEMSYLQKVLLDIRQCDTAGQFTTYLISQLFDLGYDPVLQNNYTPKNRVIIDIPEYVMSVTRGSVAIYKGSVNGFRQKNWTGKIIKFKYENDEWFRVLKVESQDDKHIKGFDFTRTEYRSFLQNKINGEIEEVKV